MYLGSKIFNGTVVFAKIIKLLMEKQELFLEDYSLYFITKNLLIIYSV